MKTKKTFKKPETGDTFAERLFWSLMSCIELDSATVTLLSPGTDSIKCRRNTYVCNNSSQN